LRRPEHALRAIEEAVRPDRGHARSADRDRVLAAGYDAQVAKPVDPADFIRAIAGVSGREPSAA
jgi:CheY-like chemotaxis protein